MKPVCAVLGVGPGLGLALSRRFAREGYKVAMLARNGEKLKEYQDQMEEGWEAQAWPCDLSNLELLKETLEALTPSVLIYNAVGYHPGPLSDLNPTDLEADFRVGVSGALAAVQAVLPGMRQQGSGSILVTGGGSALSPSPRWGSIPIIKAGLRNLALALHQELKPSNIYVGTVTVAGSIQVGTGLDPERIVEVYWQLHQERNQAEVVYRGWAGENRQ